ncbi:MAG: response regulator [Vicinamibacterales bacterium]
MNAEAAPRPILIVEDERLVALDLQHTLSDFGFDGAAVAASADEALARAEERPPGLVLMDIRIEGTRDGIETAEALKARYDVPVVYLTAHADEATLRRAKATLPHGYLLKPVKAAELRTAVEVSLMRHDLERRQREREQWFSATLESIADAVVAVDLDGRIAFMNAAAAALTGVPAPEGIGTPVTAVIRFEDGPAEADLPVLQALRTGAAVTLDEARLLNLTTRTPRVVADSAAPVVDASSKRILGAVMVFSDVTERQELRTRLELTERLASIGTLAAGVAHEVNNPLAVVVANTDYVKAILARWPAAGAGAGAGVRPAGSDMANLTAALGDVESAAGRIGQIVSDLKAFARPAADADGPADVATTIEWALRATAHEFKTRARVERRLAPVPPAAINPVRLGQVVLNLLTNAAQAIGTGRMDENAVIVSSHADDRGRVIIEVRDTGSGIPPELQGHIFEPFFTTKRGEGGTGLGLAICHGIVTSVGGEISVESVPGADTCFRVVLPAAAMGVTQSLAGQPGVELPSGARVLTVDDEPLLLDVIARMLPGVEVQTTTDAREALALIEGGAAFDVIFVDVAMPAMSGIEFFRRLREQHPGLAARVVFMSGGVFDKSFEEFLRTVPNRRIGKPFGMEEIRRVVADAARAE